MERREVIRRGYLRRLAMGRDDADVVKIVTGMRRCGKSTLMRQYMDVLHNDGVPDENIVYANFESAAFRSIEDSDDLDSWLSDIIPRVGRTYVLLDEIQAVRGWERSINALLVDRDVDIYITGSNAYLLSSDLSTYLSGRYVEVPMLPLSFREFLELNPADEDTDRYGRLIQYIWTGSLPMVDLDRDSEYTTDLLFGVYSTVVNKDLQTHLNVKDQVRFESIVRFVMSNIGNTTSSNSISKATGTSPATVRRYLRGLEDAFLIHKVYRYDIRGKRLMKTQEKYYVADTGIRNTVLGSAAGDDLSRQIENLVYLELKRRGYRVDIGCYRDREVDFTAWRDGSVEYFQVTQTMLSEETYERETRSLLEIGDNFPKTILSLDPFVRPLGNGLNHRNIVDWLLDDPTDRRFRPQPL